MPKPSIILPEFVFRGTTYGYPGSDQALKIPYTCTSANPVKATLFAMVCRSYNYDMPVIYVAKTENLSGLKRLRQRGSTANIEEELGWEILPDKFHNEYCEGYITLDEMKKVLTAWSICPSGQVNLKSLSERCEAIGSLDINIIENIVSKISSRLKK